MGVGEGADVVVISTRAESVSLFLSFFIDLLFDHRMRCFFLLYIDNRHQGLCKKNKKTLLGEIKRRFVRFQWKPEKRKRILMLYKHE